jgi:streptomycin 6-kinase
LTLEWGFTPLEELPGGHCSRVFADASCVLKAPFQGEELTSGVSAALKLAEAGGPAVYRHDSATGVVLMERLVPGSDLDSSPLSEADMQEVFVRIARRLSGLDPAGAMPLTSYFEFEHPLLAQLESTTQERVFLHGDLHHQNILFDGQAWRPIDPKGLVGDRHFECVAFLRNHLQGIEDLFSFTEERIHSLARQLALDPWRIAAWGLLDRLDSADGPTDDPWTRLYGVYVDLEERLRST